MPIIDRERIIKATIVLKKKKVFDFPLLLLLLDCSVRTGRLKLKHWNAYTSYNKNGQYYTLPEVPRFDENGLWRYQDICFSKYGTLKNTVVHLIGTSSSGLTGNQLGAIVGLSPRSFLHHFRDISGIRREKRQGVYVYFSDDADRYKQQAKNRLEAVALNKQMSDTDAILILVALIKHHDITVDDLAKLPEVKAKNLCATVIDGYLKQHGFGKKTPGSKR